MKAQRVAKENTSKVSIASSKRTWYNDYLKHEYAQYRMTFLEYKRLRQEGKIK